jgi:hypothetical protein
MMQLTINEEFILKSAFFLEKVWLHPLERQNSTSKKRESCFLKRGGSSLPMWEHAKKCKKYMKSCSSNGFLSKLFLAYPLRSFCIFSALSTFYDETVKRRRDQVAELFESVSALSRGMNCRYRQKFSCHWMGYPACAWRKWS